jgi:hypothetical protein
MAEYIEREILLKKNFYSENCNSEENRWNDYAIKDIIRHIPAADVAPVKHGHWIYNQNGHDWGLGAWECSLCHSVNNNLPIDKRFSPYVYAGSKYCPNCGAKMNGGENNGT